MSRSLMIAPSYKWLPVLLLAPGLLTAQVTTVTVNSGTVLQNTVRRFGVNLGGQTFYDSGQIMKNLVAINPGFEGEYYRSLVRCASATPTSCMDDNPYSGWPAGLWNGASYEIITGTAIGRTGTITGFTPAFPQGANFTFNNSGVVPGVGDYMVVRTKVPLGTPGQSPPSTNTNMAWGNAEAGWWLNHCDGAAPVGNSSVGTNTADLPPGTAGTQTVILTAPTAADPAEISSCFDSFRTSALNPATDITFLQLNGQFRLTFKAKGVSGTRQVAVGLTRVDAGVTYINQTITLTNSWATYTVDFNASDTGATKGKVDLSFTTVGQDSILLDDVSLVQQNTDPTNPTVFRDSVVNTLKTLNPGVMRFWFQQLGEPLDNLLSVPFARQRSAFAAYGDNTPVNGFTVSYSLHEFLELCELIGAEPWFVVPTTFTTAEASNLIDYLAGSTGTTYGAKRAALGHSGPWTSSFSKIHLEFGNESWNGSTFKGGSMEFGDAYGKRAQAIFASMRSTPSYIPSKLDLIVNGQYVSPGNNGTIQANVNNNDSYTIAPYMMYNVSAFSNNEDLFGTTFAEAEAFVTSAGTAEGVNNGLILANQAAINGAGQGVKPLTTSEFSLSPTGSPCSNQPCLTQGVMNGYDTSVGAGVALVDSMLQQQRAGVLTQNLFSLTGFTYYISFSPVLTAHLWGTVIDMGVTDRRRPQFLATQLANEAIANSTAMVQTVHSGQDPTWNQFLLNTVQLNNAHYIQSFAYTGGSKNALIVINTDRAFARSVNFAGNAPTGTVQMKRLSAANITDTNETANLVTTSSTTLSSFDPNAAISLPPYSMTVFTWGGAPTGPQISGVSSSAITTTSATINWTTDVPSSSQVQYGTTISYGSQSPLDGTLVTSHSITLTGLTAGTTYDFKVVSTNAASLSSSSANFTFTTSSPAPVISSIVSTNITATGATITWNTDIPSTSQVAYGTTPSYGSQTTLDSTLTQSHSVTLTGLTANTLYNFAVTSKNSSDLGATSANATFSTTAPPPPVISAVTSTALTATSATITWTTDVGSSSRVAYGTTPAYGTQSALDSTQVTSHSVNLTGLTAGTTYNYAVTSGVTGGGSATSTNFTFTTSAAGAPVISAVSASGITQTGATITWTTDVASNSRVAYGTTPSYGTQSPLDSTLVTSHTVTLTGLSPNTTYNYAVTSVNASSTSSTSANFTFTTSPAAGGPVISSVAPFPVGTTTAGILWATDTVATSQVKYGTTASYGSTTPLDSNLILYHNVPLTGLTPGTTYHFAVISTNAGGGTTTSPDSTFTTDPAPPTITAVAAGSITSASATITWTTDSPSSGQVAFGTTPAYGSQSASVSALTTSHSIPLSGLTAGTTYNFAVTSSNAAGPTTSTNFTFTTSAAPAPTITAGPAAGSITTTGATITWTTDQAASSVVNYGTTVAYGSTQTGASSVTSHSVSLTGLTSNTTYNFQVVSTNANGTATSTNVTFTTSATAPTITAGPAAGSITATSASITWTTDQAASSVVNYGTTVAYGSTQTGASSVTSHSVSLTGLTAGTTYNFQVVSTNANGTATSTNVTFTTSAPAPTITAGPAAGSITTTGATITWTTDQAASSVVNYGTTVAYGSTQTGASSVTSHSVSLTGLTSNTTYNFQVVSTNANGTATSTNVTFTTSATAPTITAGPAAGSITATSASITWTTDQAASSVVNYGTTVAYGSTQTGASSVTSHSVSLTGLTSNTTYNFQVVSTNANGTATSTNVTFATSAAAPTITAGPAAGSITATGASITWTTDQAASSVVNYGTTVAYGSTQTGASSVTSHSVSLTGLTASTTYNFQVVSTNANGTATSTNVTFTTSAPAPTITAGPAAGSITATSASITWTTDQAASSVVNYGTTVAYGSTQTGASSVTSHSVPLSGLTSNTTYNFQVVSTNANGTATSTNVTFTTSQAAPTITAGPAAGSITTTGASITWTTDQAASSVVNYGTTVAYGSTQTGTNGVTSHSVSLTGLTASTTYNFQVVSTNANGTATSTNVTFTTNAPPPTITAGPTAGSITATSAAISWTTNQAASSVVNYGTTVAYGSTQTGTNGVTSHSVSLTGLTASTTYNFQVVSTNANGTATSTNFTFTTSAPPPPAITNVTAGSITPTSAVITWNTDQATNARVSYGTTAAYGSQSPLDPALGTSHSITLTGLTSGTTYNYAAISANGAGISSASANFLFTTATAGAPVISSIAVWPVDFTTASILWTTDQNATSMVKYGTTTAYGSQTPVNSTLGIYHAVPLSGLTVGTIYHYSIVTTNGAGATAVSSDNTFTTVGAPTLLFSGVPSGPITATSLTPTSAVIAWNTDKQATTQVAYGTSLSYGSLSALNNNLTTAHSVTLTGLTPNTTYNFAALSTNASTPDGASINYTFTTPGSSGPPPVISAVTATSITQTSATITWTTDLSATSQVSYGTTTAYGSQSPLNSSLVTSHSVTLTGLTPGTTYNYDVTSMSASGSSSTSNNLTFATTSAGPPPTISSVNSSGITATSVTITWTTDVPASSQVAFGLTTAYGTQSALDSTLVTSHSVTLTGLTPGTLYNFAAKSANSAGSPATSSNFTFTTLQASSPPPVISGLAAYPVADTSAGILWGTDQPTNAQVKYGTTASYGSLSAVNPTMTPYHAIQLTGLASGTTYHVSVVSTNAAGVTATSPDYTFRTTGVTAAPGPVISGVNSSGITNTSATVSWTTDQPASTQVSYGPTAGYGYLSALDTSLTTSHTATVTGLTPATLYNFQVLSTNGTGIAASSGNFTFVTTGSVVGPVLTGVVAWGVTGNSAVIAWSTDLASDTLVEYGTTPALGQTSALASALTTSHERTLSGLSGNTTYYYRVRSTTGAGGVGVSTIASFTTLDTAGPVISNIVVTPMTANHATVSWQVSKPATTQVEYGTDTNYGWWSTPTSGLTTTLGWVPSGTIHYRLHSTDAGGNQTTSPDLTFVEP